MKVLQNTSTSPTLAVVCCQHGNERYGLVVFNYLAEHIANFPGLKIILANEPALNSNVRFIETDLNRSFPGSINGSAEERLAVEILDELAGIERVLDIHTTTSDVKLLPIVTELSEDTCKIINLIGSHEVAVIEEPLGNKSLIGNVRAGVSLEYGNEYAAREETLGETMRLISNVLNEEQRGPVEREVYFVTGGMADTVTMPTEAENFSFIPEAEAYAILLYEKAYVGLHALAATRREKIVI